MNAFFKVALVGNPNCGKTTLFNILTGASYKVGNWPGVTVEKKTGKFYYDDYIVEIVDLPGTYSLSARTLDEEIARNYILGCENNSINEDTKIRKHFHNRKRLGKNRHGDFLHKHHKHFHDHNKLRKNHNDSNSFLHQHSKHYHGKKQSSKPDLIINIIDASNLERNLYLTLQLLEMKIPVLAVLNMNDVAKSKKIMLNPDKLSDVLGIPVVEVTASKALGIDDLKESIVKYSKNYHITNKIEYSNNIESNIESISEKIDVFIKDTDINKRWLAIKLLEKDETVKNLMCCKFSNGTKEKCNDIIKKFEEKEKEDAEILIADNRYSVIKKISNLVQKKEKEFSHTLSDKIDQIVLNRIFGIPIFLLILFFMFWISTEVANAGIDFMESLFHGGTLLYWDFEGIIPLLQEVIGVGNWVDIILLQGVLGGVATVLSFIPILILVFLIIAFLEDWGYLSRAATVMDRFMRFIGLPGKAFISFTLGFGCTVPAIMSTRTLEDQNERWLTIMLVPFMSCGAKIPVYIFFAAIFFSGMGGSIIFMLYIIGMLVAIIVGLILKKWKMGNKAVSTFVIELPPYHIPSVKSVLITMWNRLFSFIKNAGILITIIVLVLSVMANIQVYKPVNAEEDYKFTANSRESLIGTIGEKISVIFRPLKFGEIQNGENKGETNWRASVAIFSGLFAKEAVVGTYGALYSLGESNEKPDIPENPDYSIIPKELTNDINYEMSINTLNQRIKEIETIYDKIDNTEDSIDVVNYLDNLKAMRDWKKLKDNIRNDFSPFSAFLFLLFILLYTPCISAIAATYRELGGKWATFQAIGQVLLAYIVVLAISLIFGIFIGF